MFCRNSHTRTAFHLYGSSYDKPNVSSNWMFSGTHYMWMASNQCCCGCVDEHLELIGGCQKANIIYRPEHHSHSLALAEVVGCTSDAPVMHQWCTCDAPVMHLWCTSDAPVITQSNHIQLTHAKAAGANDLEMAACGMTGSGHCDPRLLACQRTINCVGVFNERLTRLDKI